MIKNRIRDIELSIRKISEKAAEKEDCIRLDIGQPSFDTPEHVKKAAKKGIDQKQGYTSTLGIDELREQIVVEENSKKGVDVSKENIMVTTGGMEALFALFTARLAKYDKVLLNDPCWGPYKLISGVNGNDFVQERFFDDSGELNSDLESHMNDAEAVIVNTPSNPEGRVLSKQQAKEIAELAEINDTFLISDEVYHRLTFSTEHHSPAQFTDKSAIIGSTSKNHGMTGWRIGWIVVDAAEIGHYAKVSRAMTASPNKIGQIAAVEALKNDKHVEKMRESYNERRDYAVERMKQLGWEFRDPDGAIYAFPDVEEDSWEFCMRMIDNGVAMVPGEPFGPESDTSVRICFGAVEKSDLEKAFDRIEANI